MSSIVRKKVRQKNIWAELSRMGAVVYHFCLGNRLSKILFSNPFPKKNAEVMNLENPDLDLIRSILLEWILWIHDPFLHFPKKTQNPVRFKNPFSDFPTKTHPEINN